jgi:hypothetical protein
VGNSPKIDLLSFFGELGWQSLPILPVAATFPAKSAELLAGEASATGQEAETPALRGSNHTNRGLRFG